MSVHASSHIISLLTHIMGLCGGSRERATLTTMGIWVAVLLAVMVVGVAGTEGRDVLTRAVPIAATTTIRLKG